MSSKSSPTRKGALKRMKDSSITGRLEGIVLEDLVPPQEPLLNIFTFGWMEDGRLGYEADISSHIQSIPRPIAALRVSKMKKKGPPAIKGGKESDLVAQESKHKEADAQVAAEFGAGVAELDESYSQPKLEERFVVKGVAAGSRHTLLYTSNVYPESEGQLAPCQGGT